jgi:hypothetical protein
MYNARMDNNTAIWFLHSDFDTRSKSWDHWGLQKKEVYSRPIIKALLYGASNILLITCKVIDTIWSRIMSLVPEEQGNAHSLIEDYALTIYFLLDNKRANETPENSNDIVNFHLYVWTIVRATRSKTQRILNQSKKGEMLKRYMENIIAYFPYHKDSTQWIQTPQVRFEALTKKGPMTLSLEEKRWCLDFGFSLIHIKEIGWYLPKYKTTLDENIRIFWINFLNEEQKARFIPDYK